MKVLFEEKTHIRGWSLFSHIERPHAAMVTRDPFDLMIKGVRYQISSLEPERGTLKTHHFSFENWSYKARGAIEHRTFLSFKLRERAPHDTRVLGFVSDLKMINKSIEVSDDIAFSALKCAAFMIDQINVNQNIDGLHVLKKYGLISNDVYMDELSQTNPTRLAS